MATTLKSKKTWLWALYDFANSLAFVNVSYYFAIWFINEKKGSDVWISTAVALSTVLLVFTAPVFGKISDNLGRRMPFLITFTLICIISLIGLGLSGANTRKTTSQLVIIIFLYFIFNYFYQLCLTFYHSFLNQVTLAPSDKDKVSGFGFGLGQLGNVMGLLLIFPIAQNKLYLFNLPGIPAGFLIGAFLYLLFVLPTFIWLKDTPEIQIIDNNSFGKSFKETFSDIKKIRQYPGVLTYLLTFYFFADSLLTLQLFGTFYLVTISGLSQKQLMIASLLNLFFGVIGAWLSAYISRFFKEIKRTIFIFILIWAVSFFALAFIKASTSSLYIFACGGFAFGVLFSLSRAYYSNLVPRERQGEFFGLYVLFERTASILGPLVWSGTAVLFASHGNQKYRFSMASLAILVLISAAIFRFAKEPLNQTEIK